MAVPKRKTSKGRRNRRRSHSAATEIKLVVCDKCKALKKPHVTCEKCGKY